MINADVFTPTKIQNGTGIYDARLFPFIGNAAIEVLDGTSLGVPFKTFNCV